MATATFVGLDTVTQGSWIGIYGADGYYIGRGSGLLSSDPGYLSGWSLLPDQRFSWADPDSGTPSLQIPPGGSSRVACTWFENSFSTNTLTVTFDVGATTRRVSLYFLDYDSAGRAVSVAVKDGGATLDTQAASSFVSGKWLSWDVTGSLTVVVAFFGTALQLMVLK